ncbi:MAG TPA: hypothetical protein VMA98_07880 [Candidatus Acidoferrales bacterium]|nr:hypothetical protein [Candidatus Acidoferrales bacterium]
MSSNNGESKSGPLELSEVLYIETKDGGELPFEVVGILEDPDDGSSYAVLMHEPQDDDGESEFIVTDLEGNLLEDETLAQEILDEFLVFAEEAGEEGGES